MAVIILVVFVDFDEVFLSSRILLIFVGIEVDHAENKRRTANTSFCI